MKSPYWIITLAAVITLVFSLTWFLSAPDASLILQDDTLRMVPPLALFVILGSMVIYTWICRPKPMAKTVLIWAGLSSSLVMAYLYRGDLISTTADLGPGWSASATAKIGEGEVSIRAAKNGHFFASAMVNGTHVDFLVDTGATSVALTEFDALRLGFTREDLIYDRPVSTANGQTFAAAVMLDQITIGDIEVKNVRGSVLEDGLEISLLGMTFLNQLGSFTVDQDRLIMRR